MGQALQPMHGPRLQPVAEISSDEHLIRMWLHGKASSTIRSYSETVRQFLAFVGVPLPYLTVNMLQDFDTSMDRLADATRNRKLATIKSLLTFGHQLGYLPHNVGRPVKLPKVRDRLNERYLSELEVLRLIALETHPRNHALVAMAYYTALRVSELCAATWRDVTELGGAAAGKGQPAGQITVYGKGSKTRTVLIPATAWKALSAMRPADALADDPIFASQKTRKVGLLRRPCHLNPRTARRIVDKAARRAGLTGGVSPHWLRHASASHALDNGAQIHLVQQTLGHESLSTTSRYTKARPNDSSTMYLAA